eukprot:6779504-Pyramimonas_sp.AAC.1
MGSTPGGILIEPSNVVPLNNQYQAARETVEEAERQVCWKVTGLISEVSGQFVVRSGDSWSGASICGQERRFVVRSSDSWSGAV